MAASEDKRTRRKPAAASVTIPHVDTASAESAPPLPGLPGASVPARPVRRTVAKATPAKVATPAAPIEAPAPAAPIEAVATPVVAAPVPIASLAPTAPAVAEAVETVTEQAEQAVETATQSLATAAHDTADAVQAPIAKTTDLAVEASRKTENVARAALAKQETTIMDTVQNTAEKTQAFFADANERTKGAMEKGAKLFQEMTEFGKGNVEAVVESSKIAARGFETMGQDAAAYLKTSFEEASQALRTLSSIKSPTELMKFQADYMRSAFDAMVAQTSRGTEASLKLAGEVAQPISNRVAVAAEKLKVNA